MSSRMDGDCQSLHMKLIVLFRNVQFSVEWFGVYGVSVVVGVILVINNGVVTFVVSSVLCNCVFVVVVSLIMFGWSEAAVVGYVNSSSSGTINDVFMFSVVDFCFGGTDSS